MIQQLYERIIDFVLITFTTEAFWTIMPLAIATLLIIIYFGIYRDEKPDWNTHFSNSFVLLFVSIALFRHIYGINNAGEFNFVNYWGKTIAAIFLLGIGMFMVRFNFEHLLPMKIAAYLNSPLTVNIFAYAVLLFVYSPLKFNWISIFALMIIMFVLFLLLVAVKIPLARMAKYMQKEKELERIKSTKEAVFEIKEMKERLKEREKELERIKLNELEKERKSTVRLEKIIKKLAR